MPTSSLTRREFTASAVLAALATACARVAPKPAPKPAPAPASTTPAAAQPQQAQDPNTPLADALLTVAVAQYGAHIMADERTKVRDGILRNLRLANRLRSVPITNADEPHSACVNAMEEGR